MAIIEVKVPQLSESVAEATLLDWHKKEGEAVARDENLIDIETDKVVLELPAPADGVLVRILKNAKESVGSGDIIAQIDTEAAARPRPDPGPARRPQTGGRCPSTGGEIATGRDARGAEAGRREGRRHGEG